MKKFQLKKLQVFASCLCVCLMILSLNVHAEDPSSSPDEKPFHPASQKASEFVSQACSVCHGVNGLSKWPFIPNLAAQDKTYIETQLKAFRMRARADRYAQAEMWGMAQPLKDDEITALADYFSQLTPPPGHSTPQQPFQVIGALAGYNIGEMIFEKGFPGRSIPACNTCHKLHAEGDTDIPRLAGQHADYLFRELREFRNGFRSNDIMHFIADNMSDEEMKAVATALSSMGPTTAMAAQISPAALAMTPSPEAATTANAPSTMAPAAAMNNGNSGTPKKFQFFTTPENQTLKCAVSSNSGKKMRLNCSILKKSVSPL